jgi:hypothetical protein
VSSTGWRAKAAVLIATGGLAVHELRYTLAYGPHAEHAEAAEGHGYLLCLVPLVAAVAFLTLIRLLSRIGRPGEAPPAAVIPGFPRLWVAASACLVGLYTLQETLEGALAPGHPGGLAALLGHGGWSALPLAIAIGAAVAVALRGARAATGALDADAPRIAIYLPGIARVTLPIVVATRRDELARHLAGRGPPLTSA